MAIDRISAISYIDFFCEYLLQNKPCILSSDFTMGWRSIKEWVYGNGTPHTDNLVRNFGDVNVPFVDMENTNAYDGQTQNYIKFDDFIRKYLNKKSSYYLKDWHFVKEFPSYQAYTVPIYFQNDWMNEYWDDKNDPVEIDYRFVYMGSCATWTPIHADVFRSYSWSANVCGEKLWYLVRPGAEVEVSEQFQRLKNSHDDLKELATKNNSVVEIVQKSGEIIFVPSNWHHQVHNLQPTISINHNWCNGANIDCVWNYLNGRLSMVKGELADCKSSMTTVEWLQQCQVILKCDAGMDLSGFGAMLIFIGQRRLLRIADRCKSGHFRPDLISFTCTVCSRNLGLCERGSDCLGRLQRELQSHCSCSRNCDKMCIACSNFFDMFDLYAVVECMRKVVGSDDIAFDIDFVKRMQMNLDEFRRFAEGCFSG